MQKQAEGMVIGHESLENRMENIVDGIAQEAEGITQQVDGCAAGEGEQRTHILELQQGTTKERGQLLAHERDID
jgi:hypothetical protein